MKVYVKWLLGISLGALAGYLYWHFVGCNSGSCAITSSPVNSTLYGSVMGVLLVNAFNSPSKENGKNAGEE